MGGRSHRSRAPRATSRSKPQAESPDVAGGALPSERLLALYRPDLSTALHEQDPPTYRHRQIFEHLMRPGMRPFAEATALPAGTRDFLDALGQSSLDVAARRGAQDGTVKLLLACRDGVCVETVVMPYQKRTTACISTQAGCAVGCGFCATGAAGFRRNLTVSEIVDQVRVASLVAAEGDRRISNVVYMGMGEPLLNLQAVLSSIKILASPLGLGFGHRSLAVSTVGIPAGIVRLAKAEPQVNLALSLHAPSDRVRELLVPDRHRHPLSDILDACWEHFALTRRKLMVEYVLLSGVNDSTDHARSLAALLRGHVLTVNLLSWNPVRMHGSPGARGVGAPTPSRRGAAPLAFSPSPSAAVAGFRDTLRGAGIEVTIRESRGADIEAACGQLAGRGASYDGTPHR